MTCEELTERIKKYRPFNEQEEADKVLILDWIGNNKNAFFREDLDTEMRDRRHDGQAQFGILIERVDVVVLEEYTDTVAQKLARVLDRVERVSGEAPIGIEKPPLWCYP